jgi:hypothetical protein
MANPIVLFENILEDGTLTPTTTASGAPSDDSTASGFPGSNVLDWRLGTPYRWKSDDTTQTVYLHLDLGSGNSAQPDTFVIAGHNSDDVHSNDGLVRVQHSDDNSAWTNSDTGGSDARITDNLPYLIDLDNVSGAHRYWRVRVSADGTLANPWQVGIATLGRRLTFDGGAQAELDPYGFEMVVEDSSNENGSPIGVNVRYKRKTFQLTYSDVGMSRDDFFQTAGLDFDDHFVPHLEAGKPFWFAWNIDVEANDPYLCKWRTVRMPFIGSTKRRALLGTLDGFRETA